MTTDNETRHGLRSRPEASPQPAGRTKPRSVGSLPECDLVLEDESVSPLHAQVQLTAEGYLSVLDTGSEQGTFLQRNDQWIRMVRAELGTRDRIRFGGCEVELDELAALFDDRIKVQWRDTHQLRMPVMMADRLAANQQKIVLERPRRNPETGNIEENDQPEE